MATPRLAHSSSFGIAVGSRQYIVSADLSLVRAMVRVSRVFSIEFCAQPARAGGDV
jgi:hypothetical protein